MVINLSYKFYPDFVRNESDSVCWPRASGYGVSPLTKHSDQDGRNLMWRVEHTRESQYLGLT